MGPVSVHQTIHGYRDGHRLLSSSTPLSADAARVMLVLSDMSGPSIQPGFDEYLTGYPLPGSDLFVFAKTWYAPEMQRPGCVWTHSLLIPQAQISHVATACLLEKFQRPRPEDVEKAAAMPIVFDVDSAVSSGNGFSDRAVAAALLGTVLGQPRPVIVVVDTAAQIEAVVLQLWEELWPAERARFSFCTGALMPRSNASALLDLQAVPRAIPPAQFRKSAGTALVLDIRAPSRPEAWVDLVIDRAMLGDATFRTWLETAAGADAGRSVVSSLVPIFGEWHAPNSSARSVITSVANSKFLDPSVQGRLIGMAFDRAGAEAGTTRQELLQDLCGDHDIDLAPVTPMLEDQARKLFEESRAEGVALVLSLLGSKLTEVGERVLRAAVLLLVSSDLETFGDMHAPFLPTIVAANSHLASSPVLWKRVGARSGEVLAHLGKSNLSDEDRMAVVDAILASGLDISVDGLVRFGGKVAIFQGLSALATGQVQLSWSWRSTLSAQPDSVLEWVENLPTPPLRHLELGSQFLSPRANQARLAKVWKTGTAGAAPLVPRVAAFGLALALWEGIADSPLLAACFQPTYDAAGSSRLEYDEWDWLREHAPSVSWYHDWDRCERLAAALARLIEKQTTSLETVFQVVHSRAAIRKVAALLDADRDTRPYLKSLRKKAESSSNGTREQRDALLEDW
ncbi:MAG TPA: hypothetical protein VMV90_00345 [Rectinemataceae bacterium]|nr:hypothetical protein [Rectinemataceae bacterium]